MDTPSNPGSGSSRDTGDARDLTPLVVRSLYGAVGLLVVAIVFADHRIAGRLFVPDGRITNHAPLVTTQLVLGALAAALLLGAWALRRRSGMVTRSSLVAGMATLLVTSALCVGAAEIFVRTTMHPIRTLTPNTDAWWECRWRSEREGRDSPLTREKYGFDTYDAELGWAPRPGYDDGTVTVNADGIRAVTRYRGSPGGGRRRVVIVGDSYTWGENVTNAETYAAQMESVGTGLEVVNLGVHGYGTDQQLLRLRRDGFPLDPDVVVLGIFGQNVNRNVLAFRDYAKPRFQLIDGALVLENREIPTPEALLARGQSLPPLRLWSLAVRAARNARDRSRLRDVRGSERWQVTRAILTEAWRECTSRGARFLLVYIPWRVHTKRLPFEHPIADYATESGVPFLNLREAFLELPVEEQEALYGGHWTPLGHRRAAEAIVRQLDRLPDAR